MDITDLKRDVSSVYVAASLLLLLFVAYEIGYHVRGGECVDDVHQALSEAKHEARP